LDGSAVKKTWGQYKENASIPWKKKVISGILQDLEFPILLRDLKDSTFHPQFPLNDNIYFLTPERSPRGNFLLRPIVEAYKSNPADKLYIPEELDFYPIEKISAEFEVSVRKTMYGIELLTNNLSPKVFQMLTNFRLMNEIGVGPLLRIEGNKGFYFGSIPTHRNKGLRSSYYEGYLTCLFSNVMRKESRKEQIIVRKSAIQESDDTEMKLPGHFFTSAQTTYHFYLEDEEISLLLSLKNGYLQIVRVKNYHDVKVFHSNVGALIEDGYVTTKSIKSELKKISDSLVFVDKKEGYDVFKDLLIEQNLLGEISSLKPNLGVLTDLLTPSAIGQHETVVEAKQLMDEGQELWFEDWMYYVQLGMKLFATLQDPGSKQIMSLLTREYIRGEVRGNSTKFKMWGIKANLIKPGGKKSHSTNRNRAHYVRGFNRRQPIKNTEKYQEEGYLILEEDQRFFVDKQISPHWRGNKELGTIETIYHLGDSTKGSYSNKAVRWLQAISAEKNIEIKHAKNGGEQVFPAGNGRYIRVDGFCESTNQVFEFYGDYWHGNPDVFDPQEINKSNKKTFSQLYAETLEREEWIRGLGFELITIWENEFDKPKKSS
jgi:hypothetical protein